jgi:hypothetical protein
MFPDRERERLADDWDTETILVIGAVGVVNVVIVTVFLVFLVKKLTKKETELDSNDDEISMQEINKEKVNTYMQTYMNVATKKTQFPLTKRKKCCHFLTDRPKTPQMVLDF